MSPRLVVPAALLVAGAAALAFAPRAATAPAPAASAADPWKIDSVHSSLIFRVKHLNTSYFYGRFNDISGQIVWDDADTSAASLNIEVKTASVDTKAEGRDKHLKSADFFNADQFPVCTFKSTSIKPSDDAFELTGDLTINGQTKPVTARMEKTGQGKGQRGGELIGFETILTIKRTDFGVNYMPGGLGEDVKLFVGLEAGRK